MAFHRILRQTWWQYAGAPGVTTQIDDRLYAWETMSLLLASDDIPKDTQADVVEGLLKFLCHQITENLGGDLSGLEVMASSPPAPRFGPVGLPPLRLPPTPMMLINHALESIARLSKGFSIDRMTKACPKVGVLLLWPMLKRLLGSVPIGYQVHLLVCCIP
jgi:hypothetical protein